jgi:hypothetical protein
MVKIDQHCNVLDKQNFLGGLTQMKPKGKAIFRLPTKMEKSRRGYKHAKRKTVEAL